MEKGVPICQWCGTYWDCGPEPRCQGLQDLMESPSKVKKQKMGTIKYDIFLVTDEDRSWVQIVPIR